jgi:hypothetical protein
VEGFGEVNQVFLPFSFAQTGPDSMCQWILWVEMVIGFMGSTNPKLNLNPEDVSTPSPPLSKVLFFRMHSGLNLLVYLHSGWGSTPLVFWYNDLNSMPWTQFDEYSPQSFQQAALAWDLQSLVSQKSQLGWWAGNLLRVDHKQLCHRLLSLSQTWTVRHFFLVLPPDLFTVSLSLLVSLLAPFFLSSWGTLQTLESISGHKCQSLSLEVFLCKQ